MTDVLKNGLVGNGHAEDGQLEELIENAAPGATIYFPATTKGYSFRKPINITKSLTIQGDGAATIIRSHILDDALFKVLPTSYDERIVVHFKDFKMIDGYRGIDISGSIHISGAVSGTTGIAAQSSIHNVEIENFEEIGIRFTQQSAEMFITDVRVSASTYGFFGESFGDYNQLYVENSLFEGAEYGIYFSGAANCSGAMSFNYISHVDNAAGFIFENITYTLQSPTYINTPIQVVNSGSTQASSLTAHASTHGSGAADQILATDLTSQGVDDGAVLVSTGDGGWTTIQTSSLASDVAVDPGDFEPFSAAVQIATGALQSATASLQSATASLQTITASLFTHTASMLTHTASYLVSSASFAASSDTLDSHILDVDNPHATDIGNLDPGTLAELNSIITDATLDDSSAARTPTAHSASHYSGSSDPLSLQNLGGFGLAGDVMLVSDGAGGWKTLTTASVVAGHVVTPQAHSASHYSGSTDPLDLQELRGHGLANDVMLVSDGNGGWKTVTSSSVVSGEKAALHDETHASGANDMLNVVDLGATGIAVDRVLIADGNGGWTTVTSASMIAGHQAASHASTHASGASDAINAQDLGASSVAVDRVLISNADGGWTTVDTASMIAGHRAANHAALHNSGATDALHLQNLGGTGLSADFVLVTDGAGGWKTVASESVGTPPGAVGDHSASHYSGANDALSLQNLGAFGLGVDRMLITNGDGGWTTITSASLVDILYAASSTFRTELDSQTASIQRIDAASGTFRTEITSQTASITRLDAASGTFEAHRTNTSNPHSTDVGNLGAGTLAELNTAITDATLDDSGDPRDPNAHANTHASGASDALQLQNLGGTGLAVDRILITDGNGGWTTITSESAAPVTSVHGRIGDVASVEGDYNTSQINFSGVVGAPTFTTFGSILDAVWSPGVIVGGEITDDGDGTVTVNSGSGLLRALNNDREDLYSLDWGVTPITPTNLDTTYIYLEYNGGTPQIVGSINERADFNTSSILGTVYRSGSTIHITPRRKVLNNSLDNLQRRLFGVNGISHESGIAVSESGTRNIAISQGVVWLGLNRVDILDGGFDSTGVDTFFTFYRDGSGGWTEVIESQISNTLYDDGTGTLATLTTNRYGVHWIYVALDSDVYHIYGQGDYTSAQANDALPPSSLPPHIDLEHAALAAKIIVQEGSTNFTSVLSAFDKLFLAADIVDHGDLAGLTDDDHTQYLLRTEQAAFSASIMLATGALQSATASLQVSTGSLTSSITRIDAASASFRSELDIITAASATFRTELDSQTGSITRLDAASGTFETHRLDTANPHATDIGNLGAGTLAELNTAVTDATLDDSSAARTPTAHSASHYSGSTDPLSLQNLGGFGLAPDFVLVTDGAGGWKTVASESVGTPPGAPGAHASSHLSGGSDQLSAHLLAANALAVDRLMITDADGGWTTITSASLVSHLNAASGTFRTELDSQTASITRIDAASGTFRTELDSQTASIQRIDAASGTFEALRLIDPQTWSGTALTMSNSDHGKFYKMTAATPIVWITSSTDLGTTAEFQRKGTSLQVTGSQIELEYDTGSFNFPPAAAGMNSTIVVTIIADMTASVRGDISTI